MKKRRILSIVIVLYFVLLNSMPLQAQRLSDINRLGWFGSFNTVRVAPKTTLWLEYQWRRDELVANWQQSLARAGVQYQFKNGLKAMAGYGYIISFPYGDYPAGRHHIPEHRIFEQLVWDGALGRIGLNHRLRLEQRFAGKVDQNAEEHDVDGWKYTNRVRYQLRLNVPLNHTTMKDKTWYVSPYDEVFIGFGKNVNQNIFDQNRLGILLGYQFNKTFRAEGGYFNQTVLQGALVAGKQAVQYNHGLLLSLYVTK